MEDISKAFEQHMEQMVDLVHKFSAELRSGLQPAYANFMGFIHAIDWKVSSRPSLLLADASNDSSVLFLGFFLMLLKHVIIFRVYL